MNGAFFHDEEDLFSLADVGSGVAGDSDNIGKFAGGESAETVGDAEEFGVYAGSSFEGVDGLDAVVDEEAELASLAAMGVDAGDGAADGEVDRVES